MAMMTAERVRAYFDEQGIRYELADHPVAYTAQEIAAAEHVAGETFAKPTLLMADGKLVMAVLPGPLRVDFERARRALGVEEVRLATEAEFSSAFPDCEVGAEPPFGNLYGLPVYVDDRLTASRIVFNAGSHRQTMTMALSDFLDIVKPIRADLASG
jgi:Ala-tRNA(Pro) deacylase